MPSKRRLARSAARGSTQSADRSFGDRTVAAHLGHWASVQPEATAIISPDARLTYAEFEERVGRVAWGLRELGVTEGDRVAVQLPTCPEFVIAMLAAHRLGAHHVPICPRPHRAAVQRDLEAGRASVVVTLDTLRTAYDPPHGQRAAWYVVVSDSDAPCAAVASPRTVSWSSLMTGGKLADDVADLDALAELCRGDNSDQVSGTGSRRPVEKPSPCPRGRPIVLCSVPIRWTEGEDLGIVLPLTLGGSMVLMAQWDADEALSLIHEHHVTAMVGTVEHYTELLDREDPARHDLSSLTTPIAVADGGGLDDSLRARWSAVVGAHSVMRTADTATP